MDMDSLNYKSDTGCVAELIHHDAKTVVEYPAGITGRGSFV